MVREIPYFDRPCTPRAMVDDVLDDRDAELARDRRQEPVHLAVQLHRLHDLGAEHLQRAAVVVQLDARRPRDQPVRDHRRQPPVDERVLAVLPPARDDVGRRLLEPIDHGADVARIVLQVAVHRDDVAPARVREAGGEGGGLAEVAAELDDAQAVVRRLQPGQPRERLVRAAVVDGHDLVGAPAGLERGRQLAVELVHVGRLVLHRDDDRDVRVHGWQIRINDLIIQAFWPIGQTAGASLTAAPPGSTPTPATSATAATDRATAFAFCCRNSAAASP